MSRVACVVGGAGFLGSRLVARLGSEGWRVAVVDPAAAKGQLGASLVIPAPLDASAAAAVARELGSPQIVFHLGGSGSVGAAAADPARDRVLTVDSTRLVRDAYASARLVLVSSAAVYGEVSSGPIPESRGAAPISVYGRHKAEAEVLAATAPLHAIVRFFSLYGPGLRKQLLWDACNKLVRGDTTFGGTGDELRDWLHVDDAVSLLATVAERPEPALLINGGTGRGATVRDVLEALSRALGAARPSFSGAVRPGDPSALVADIGKATALGWRPSVVASDGVAAYARWFLAEARGGAT